MPQQNAALKMPIFSQLFKEAGEYISGETGVLLFCVATLTAANAEEVKITPPN
ncbi:hypothetical protein O9992_05350 [Vibrio lentus]|nr:hypothetical protein [Vibrio lentus]